jgi:hypothetical protein
MSTSSGSDQALGYASLKVVIALLVVAVVLLVVLISFVVYYGHRVLGRVGGRVQQGQMLELAAEQGPTELESAPPQFVLTDDWNGVRAVHG